MKLHDYQIVARDHLQRTPRGALLLDMGLGKTCVTLCALTDEDLPVLVVAPKRVAQSVWPAEARKWRPDLSLALAAGSPQNRARELHSGKDIIVIGRDNLRDVLKLKTPPFKTIVLDELSGFKARSSGRWKTARAIIRKAGPEAKVWGLTGTPSPNGLMDLWAQVYLLDGGVRLFKTLTEFRARFFTPGKRLPNGVVARWDLIPGMDEKIHAKIEDICLSMETEGRIELPPMIFNEIEVELPPAARKAYRELKADLVTGIDVLGTEVIHSASTGATLSNRLQQLSAGFMYEDATFVEDPTDDDPYHYSQDNAGAYSVVHREKIKAVQEVVEGTGSPVLVFYHYKAELELLLEAFGEDAHTIDEDGVIESWNAGQIPVLLAHPASAGHGLNLQYGGHTIVWTSLTWSLEEWEQANKRLARQGQEHPVMVHLIMARKTVDRLIRQRLDGKANVQNALLAHLESPI